MPDLHSAVGWLDPAVAGDDGVRTPFVMPTVLAALFCVLKHPDSWSGAVTTAIRLGGDVDTLGAIVGALAGARDGLEAIPHNLVSTVQHSSQLQALARRYHSVMADQSRRSR